MQHAGSTGDSDAGCASVYVYDSAREFVWCGRGEPDLALFGRWRTQKGITLRRILHLGFLFCMLETIRTLCVFSLGVALAIAVLLYTQASAVSRLFINNRETVAYD